MHLFLAVLGLHCHMRASLLLQCLLLLWLRASGALALWLWGPGLAALWPVESSCARIIAIRLKMFQVCSIKRRHKITMDIDIHIHLTLSKPLDHQAMLH